MRLSSPFIVNDVLTQVIDQQICNGQSVDFNGTTYNTTGSYSATLTSSLGCDSIVTLNLTVTDQLTDTIRMQICNGQSQVFNGQVYNQTGTYAFNTTSTSGCDSTAVFILSVLDVLTESIEHTLCEGEAYAFNGTDYNTSGTYTATLTSSSGCDSIVTLNLTVNPIIYQNTTHTICAGDTYSFNGTDYNTSGTYTATLTSSTGCDSIVTLDLTVLQPIQTILNEQICNGDSYSFNGTDYNTSGMYSATLTSRAGCDSIVTLNLIVNDVLTQVIDQQICNGQSVDFNGTTYNTTGSYSATLTSSLGCDSIVTLNLTVTNQLTDTIRMQICNGQSQVFNGQVYDQTGTYAFNTTSTSGCDSTAVLILNVLDVLTESIDHTLCEGEAYSFNGTDYNTSGTYTTTLTSSSGCDSIVTLNLTVNPTSYQNITHTICNGDTYSFNGTDYNTSGTYTATLTSSTGCDSVVTLDLTVRQPIQTNLNEQICNGDSYSFNGTDYNTSGTYAATLTSSAGCDSTVTLNLIVKEVLTEVIDQQICNGQSVDFNGTNYNSTGSYTATLTSSLGCDSIVTLNLTVTDQLTDTIRMQICNGQSQVFNGQVYDQTGTYSFNTTSSNGCDSTAVLVLNVLNTLTESIDHTLCEGETYAFNGTDYNTSGTYTATLTSSSGCDSIVTLNLTVNPIIYQNTIHTICAGDTYSFNGTDYNTSGTYTATLTSSTGCDSVITLDLTVLQPIQTNLNEQICNGDSYSFNGTDYNTSGTYSATLTSSSGCDSTVTLNLIVNDVLTEVIDQQICNGQSVDFNGTTYNTTGSYTATLTSSLGCDSVVTLNLTVTNQLTDTIRMQICNGQSQVFNGQVYDQTGTYAFNTTSTSGCDSTAVLVLSVLDVLTESIEHTLCDGQTYSFNGTNYNTSGTYTTTLTSSSGCDSIVTLNLTVNPISYQNTIHTICAGDTYSFNGTDYNASGTYTATLTSSTGCDSVITLDLTVLQPIQTNLNEQICNSDSYSFNGTDYNTSGTYSATLTSSSGCDSTVTLNLIVNEVLTEVIDQQICNGQSVDFNGTTYNSTGSFSATLSSSLGCDSIVTLNLTVTDQLTDTIRMQICNGQSQVFNGQSYNQTGTYAFNTTSTSGCDSTAVLILSVLDVLTESIEHTLCEGEAYPFNGTDYNTSGTYTATLTSSSGCDSIVTLNLTVNPISYQNITHTICAGDTYSFNGTDYNTSGTYTATLTSSTGCDSIITLDLTVLQPIQTNLNEQICNGDSYSFNGTDYNTSGTYSTTLSSSLGCDSTITLNLIVKEVLTEVIDQQICNGQSVDFNGTTYNSTGSYTATLTSSLGCDSIVTLNLTVTDQLTDTIRMQICNGQSQVFNGQVYDQTGTYAFNTTSTSGCDSTAVLILNVLDVLTESIEHTLCEGETYSFNGTNYNSTGSYTATLTSSSGCDSIVTLNLTVNPISYQNTIHTICAGDTYSFNGSDYNTSGTYIATLTSSTGCDSIITLDLTVLQPIQTILNEQICNGDSYSFNGTDYNTSGTYSTTLSSSLGCDSTITLNLIVKEVLTEVIDQQICNGQSVDFNGTTYNSTGSYTATLTSSLGCDSIVTLNLTVTDQLTDTIRMQICNGQSQVFNGQVYDQTGSYAFNTTSTSGCDSTAVLILSVLDVLTESINHTLCEGETYSFNGTDYNTSGTYTTTLTSSSGCDSIVTLNLTVNPISYQNITHTICNGDTYSFNGTDYNTSGTYTATLTSSTGCDSIITLDLTVRQPIQTNLNEQICNGESYSFNGTDYNTSGTYSATLTSSSGCDSTVTLNLIVKEVLTEVIDQQICNGQSVDFNGTTYNSTGSYTATLTSSLGCDSIVTLNLTVTDQLTDTIRMQICNGQSQVFNGQVYDQTGTYAFNTTSTSGCDSTAVLILNVLDVLTESIDHTLCEGEAYSFNGTDYNTSGTYTATLTSSSGCDSIVTLNLTVNPIIYQNTAHTICAGDTYSFNGSDYNTSGTYTATLTSSTGCDSVVTIDLTVRQPIQTILNEQICNGDSYSFNGADYNTSGTYTATLTSSLGCDSIVTLNLIVKEVLTEVIDQQICNGQSVDFNGTTYNTTGSYTATLISSLGCDSIVTLNLTVTDQLTDTIRMQICGGQSIHFNQKEINKSGIYHDTLTSIIGCDSIITLNLTIQNMDTVYLQKHLCEGESFVLGNDRYTKPGKYTINLQSINGCDSIVMLYIQVEKPSVFEYGITLCSDEYYQFDGKNLTASGQYRDTLTNRFGCDSLVILNLKVLSSFKDSFEYTICLGDTIQIDNNFYTQATQFSVFHLAVNGCDSVVNYKIIVIPEILLIAEEVTICQGESVVLGVTGGVGLDLKWEYHSDLSCTDCSNPEVTPKETTTYTVSAIGCKGQVVSTSIKVNVVEMPGLSPIEDVEVKKGKQIDLFAQLSNPDSKINWYNEKGDLLCEDCPKFTVNPNKSSSYTVVATNEAGCIEEYEFIVVVKDDCELDKIEVANALTPNNDGYNDFFEIKNNSKSEIEKISIFNRWGEKVFESKDLSNKWDGTFRNMKVNSGVFLYIIEGKCVSGDSFLLNGNVTVIK